MAERIGFLARGRLVAEGGAADLKKRAAAPDLEEAFIRLTGEDFKKDGKEEAL